MLNNVYCWGIVRQNSKEIHTRSYEQLYKKTYTTLNLKF